MNMDWEQELAAVKAQITRLEKRFAEQQKKPQHTQNENSQPIHAQNAGERHMVDTEQLQRLVESRVAEQILRCIGNTDRLFILLALLKEPLSVAAMVEKCGYNSTGQAYHHLKPLIAADLVREARKPSKGTYIISPDRVQSLLLLLSGVQELLGNQPDKGIWGQSTEMHAGATMVDERYLATAEETQKIIRICFRSTQPLVLKTFPPKEKKKLVILNLIAQQFQPDRQYSEKEVNQILEEIYTDYVTIRRYLIEYGYMDRTVDCSAYWLCKSPKQIK